MHRLIARSLPCLAWFWVVLVSSVGTWDGALAAEEPVSFAGTYRDERIAIELDKPAHAGNRTTYTGTIQLGDQKFPLKADAEEEHLKGTFESQGDPFDFAGTVVGRMLVFTTDGTTYRLKKQIINPLARNSKPNPLVLARSNTPPSSPTPAPTPTAVVPIVATPAPTPTAFRFRRCSVLDDTNMIGGEALSFLCPADWIVDGGLGWRMHPTSPVYISLRVSNPARTEVLETFPTIPFVWAEGGIPLFPSGSVYMGNEVGEPMDDPVVYVQKILLPRFRPNLGVPKVVATEELPKIADAISEGSQEAGVEKKFRAARVRLEYAEAGRMFQEDIYCVLVVVNAPTLHTTFWGPDRNYSFKAEKGKLEGRTRLFQTILNSFHPNLQWVNRYMQLVPLLVQAQIDNTHPVVELTRFAAQTSPELNDFRRQTYERQVAAQVRINARFAQQARGLEEYRNPIDNSTLDLPIGYACAWAHPLGDVALSDDSAFNPNTAANNDWQKLEKAH